MAAKYLDYAGLQHFWGKIKSFVSTWVSGNVKVWKTVNVETSANVSTNLIATQLTDVLYLKGRDGIKLEGNATTDTLTISFDGATSAFNGVPIKVYDGDLNELVTPGLYAVQTGNYTDVILVQGSSSGIKQLKLSAGSNLLSERIKPNETGSSWTSWSDAIPVGVSPYDSNPAMNGTASAGSSALYSRGDHVHPKDTTKADKVSGATSGHLAALDANGNLVDSGVSATSAGSDTKVTQSAAISTNGEYPIILANGTATTEVTGTVNKSANLKYNPSTKALTTGGKVNGLTLTAATTGFTIAGGTTSKTLTVNNTYTLGAACAKSVDTSVAESSTSTNLPTTKAVADAITAAKVAPSFTKDANNNYPQSAEPAANATGNIIATAGWVNTKITNATSDKVTLHDLDSNGYVKTDGNGLIPSTLLPSYVDDVVEAYARSGQTALSSTWLATGSASGTVITPAAGKIYILMADYPNSTNTTYAANTQFRWSGTAYVKLNDGGVSAITDTEIDGIVANTDVS